MAKKIIVQVELCSVDGTKVAQRTAPMKRCAKHRNRHVSRCVNMWHTELRLRHAAVSVARRHGLNMDLVSGVGGKKKNGKFGDDSATK